MTRIGKISFALNIAIATTILVTGLLNLVDLRDLLRTLFFYYLIPANVIILAPLAVHAASCVLALPFAAIKRKTPPASNTINKAFGLYPVIALISTSLLALTHFRGTYGYLPANNCLIILSAILFAVAIANITASLLTGKAVLMRKKSGITSAMLVTASGIIILVLALVLPLHYIRDNNKMLSAYREEWAAKQEIEQALQEVEASIASQHDEEDEEDEENEDDGEIEEHELYSDRNGELASMYFYSKMELAYNEASPFHMRNFWKFNGWKDTDQDSYLYNNINTDNGNYTHDPNLTWTSRAQYRSGKAAFYKIYDEYNRDLDQLEQLYFAHIGTFMRTISTSIAQKTGLSAMIKAALLSYNDLHSREDTEETLARIYAIMNNPAEELPLGENGEVVGSAWLDEFYPHLKKYMSNETIDQMSPLLEDEDCTDCVKANTVWAYSFWARRHHNGTTQSAYKILKHFNDTY